LFELGWGGCKKVLLGKEGSKLYGEVEGMISSKFFICLVFERILVLGGVL